MDPFTDQRSVPQLAFPFGIVGGSAALACACLSGFVGSDTSLGRGHVSAVVGFLAGVVVGFFVTRWIRDGLPTRWILKLFAFVSFSAAFAGGVVIAATNAPSSWGPVAVFNGAWVGVVVSPALAFGVWHARRAVRSRARSIAGPSDRRSALRIAAVACALMTPLLPFELEPPGVFARPPLAPLDGRWLVWPVTLLAVGAALALFTLVRDALAYQRARVVAQLVADAEGLRREPSGAGRALEAAPGIVDLGLGEDTWLHTEGMAGYRSFAVERPRVVGDLDASLDLARRACLASSAAFALVYAIVIAVAVQRGAL